MYGFFVKVVSNFFEKNISNVIIKYIVCLYNNIIRQSESLKQNNLTTIYEQQLKKLYGNFKLLYYILDANTSYNTSVILLN